VLFANEKIFPLALGQLMAVGERTGTIDEMLTSIAKYYEEEFTTVVDGLSTIIEPLMIVFVGAMIGIIVVALYLPVFSAGAAIRQKPERKMHWTANAKIGETVQQIFQIKKIL
jgi:type IV pilus assembly protein PilC